VFRWVLAAAIAVVVALILPNSAGAQDRTEDERVDRDRVVAHVIADSVLLGARSHLWDLGLRVDAVEGRQPTRLVGAVKKLPDDGLPVVVHLGTNGRFGSDVCRGLVRLVEGERDVVLVTVRAPRPWTRASNSTIRACARRIDESAAVVVPWHRLANTDARLLYSDGIHLTSRGREFLAERIRLGLGLCEETAEAVEGRQVARVGGRCKASDAPDG